MIEVGVCGVLIIELVIQTKCVAPVYAGKQPVFAGEPRSAVFVAGIDPERKPVFNVQRHIRLTQFLALLEHHVDFAKRIAIQPIQIRQ